MNGYLLDTCVLSELAKVRPAIPVIEWFEAQEEASLFLSVLTLGELQKGIEKCPEPDRRARLQAWLSSKLLPRFQGKLLPVCERSALVWGRLSAQAELAGNPLPLIDLLLASTASVHRLTVATRNIRDFERCSVAVFNPWQS